MEGRPPDGWHPALVVVDVQNKFYNITAGLSDSFNLSRDALNFTISMFREADLPIIFVFFDGEGSCMSDCDNADSVIDGVDFRPGDIIVHKTSMNCFYGSDLSAKLTELGCDSIVLSGMVAHLCVLSTYFSAYDNGFEPYIASGTLAATKQENVSHVEAIAITLDPAALRRKLASVSKGRAV